MPSIPGKVFGSGALIVESSSSAAFFGNHALRILARSGANKHSSSQPSDVASLHLAVCPSAACSPSRGAKVPHAIVSGFLPFGSQRIISARACSHAHFKASDDSTNRSPCRWFTGLARSGTIPSSHIKGVLACTGQMLSSKAPPVLAHPPVLLAPA